MTKHNAVIFMLTLLAAVVHGDGGEASSSSVESPPCPDTAAAQASAACDCGWPCGPPSPPDVATAIRYIETALLHPEFTDGLKWQTVAELKRAIDEYFVSLLPPPEPASAAEEPPAPVLLVDAFIGLWGLIEKTLIAATRKFDLLGHIFHGVEFVVRLRMLGPDGTPHFGAMQAIEVAIYTAGALSAAAFACVLVLGIVEVVSSFGRRIAERVVAVAVAVGLALLMTLAVATIVTNTTPKV